MNDPTLLWLLYCQGLCCHWTSNDLLTEPLTPCISDGTGLLLPAAHVVCDFCDSSDLGCAVTNLVQSRSAFALHPLLGAPYHTGLWGFTFDLFIRSGSRTWELALPCPNLGSVSYQRGKREKGKDPNEAGIG